GNSATYELTDAGREYLQTLDQYPPEPELPPASDEIRNFQKAQLLFQLYRSDGKTLSKGEANRQLGPQELELTPEIAPILRNKLSRVGALEIIKGSRSETYKLLPAGEGLLATLEHYPTTQFTLKGKHLNALLGLVRSSPLQPAAPVSTIPAREEPTFP